MSKVVRIVLLPLLKMGLNAHTSGSQLRRPTGCNARDNPSGKVSPERPKGAARHDRWLRPKVISFIFINLFLSFCLGVEVVPPPTNILDKSEGMPFKANHQVAFRLSFNEYAVPMEIL